MDEMTPFVLRADLNARVKGGLVPVKAPGYNSFFFEGDPVEVTDLEQTVIGLARIAASDNAEGILYLLVDWKSFHELKDPAVHFTPASDRFLMKANLSITRTGEARPPVGPQPVWQSNATPIPTPA